MSLIVGDPQGILDQLLKLHPVHLPNIIIIIILIRYIIKLLIKEKMMTILTRARNGTKITSMK
jgi:hypothetical protein